MGLNLVKTMNIRLQKRYTEKDICNETKQTATKSNGCPMNSTAFNDRSNEKNCGKFECMGKQLVYHCVMFEHKFVEVCAPRTDIRGKCCALYNEQLGRVIEDFKKPCPNCPVHYSSDDYTTALSCARLYCKQKGNRHERDVGCMEGLPVKPLESGTQNVTEQAQGEWQITTSNNDEQLDVKLSIIVPCVFVLLLGMTIAYCQRERLKRTCNLLGGGLKNVKDKQNKTPLQITNMTISQNTEECKMLPDTIYN